MFSLFNTKIANDGSAAHKALVREVEFTFETIKLKLFDKVNNVRDLCLKQVSESARCSSAKAFDQISFNVEALRSFEKVLSKEIDTLSYELLSQGKPFEPSVVGTIEVPANIGFNYGANIYNQKHNLIISCPSNSTVHFYDANEMAPMKNRRRKQISSSVVQMSYNAENDTHLMGCAFGDVYSYNAGTHSLTKVLKEGDSFILAITHIDQNRYAFSSSKSGKLYFANVNEDKAVPHPSKDSDSWYLFHHNQRKLLFSGLANGKLAIYSTKNDKYDMVQSVQAHKFGKYVTVILTVNVKGKEYIVTGGNDHTIKLWQVIKGRLRLVRVITTTEDVSTIVYLEEYQMLATTHHRDFVRFWKLPYGKLESTLSLGLNKARNIFPMKDKNMLGVADLSRNLLKVIQLHPTGNARLEE
jgi:WD40 repeat protein